MGKELRKICPRRLNGIKKVHYYNFLNINILSILLSAAAEAGLRRAQCILGDMFHNGKGVEENVVKALEWYQKGILFKFF
jgi:TPR repeat protein